MAYQRGKNNISALRFYYVGSIILTLLLFGIVALFFYSSILILGVLFFIGLVGSIGVVFSLKSLSNQQDEFLRDLGQASRIVSDIDMAVVGYGTDFKINLWNPSAENLFNIKEKDILGVAITPASISDPRFKILVQTIYPSLAPSVVKKTDPGTYPQIININFSDPELDLTTVTDRLVDEAGNVVAFVKIIRNRTREISLLRSKSDFITVAAHQLRTPITAVHWTFETLRSSPSINPSDKELIDNGMEVSIKLVKIVNDLLDASKIESGKFGYEFSSIDIVSFIDDILKGAATLAKQFSVSLYFDRPKEPIIIPTDPQKLSMAVTNLIDNAIKYNVKNGQVTVKIEPYPGKPYVQLSIKDTGIGIPEEDVKKLFTKFYRGSNVVKEQTDGSGLGLFITKNIITRHGGNIAIESILGRGTTFYIVLPTDMNLIPPREISSEDL